MANEMELLGQLPSETRMATVRVKELVELLLYSRRRHQTEMRSLQRECSSLRANVTEASATAEMKSKLLTNTRSKLEAKFQRVQELEQQLQKSRIRERKLECRIRDKAEEQDAINEKVVNDYQRQITKKDHLLDRSQQELQRLQQKFLREKAANMKIHAHMEKLHQAKSTTSEVTSLSTAKMKADYKKHIEEVTVEYTNMLYEQSKRAEKERIHLEEMFKTQKSAIMKTYEMRNNSLQEKVDRLESSKRKFENTVQTMKAEVESLREELSKQININGDLKTSYEILKAEKNIHVKKLESERRANSMRMEVSHSDECFSCKENIAKIRRLLELGCTDSLDESTRSNSICSSHLYNAKLEGPGSFNENINNSFPVDLYDKSTINRKRLLDGAEYVSTTKLQKTTIVKNRGRPKVERSNELTLFRYKANEFNSDTKARTFFDTESRIIKQESSVIQQRSSNLKQERASKIKDEVFNRI